MNIEEEIISGLIKELNKKQDELILNAFIEKTPLKSIKDIEIEMQNRFPKIKVEYKENETNYYYNDGSKHGIKVIGLRQVVNTEYNLDTKQPFKVTCEIKIT